MSGEAPRHNGGCNKGPSASNNSSGEASVKNEQDVNNGKCRISSASRAVPSFASGGNNNPGGRRWKSKSAAPNGRRYSSNPQSHRREVMKEDEFEDEDLYAEGKHRKKSNHNYLLNFNYGPRGGGERDYSYKRGKHDRGGGQFRPKYTKEHYLQANCQFIVKSEGDYTAHLSDPDTLVAWDMIEQISLKTNDRRPSCPICLHEPKAAKMTRCGHIYCWSCVLHYLALSDRNWRKCPICDESICKEDLKSVVSLPASEHRVDEEIEMCLMRRHRSSLFAVRADSYFDDINKGYPNIETEGHSYSQLVLATPDQVLERILKRESEELNKSYELEKNEPEAVFIMEALALLDDRVAELRTHAGALACLPPLEQLSLRPRRVSSSESTERVPNNRKEDFYFYQSSDGRCFFLHGLNAKMLERQFGDLKYAPNVIKGKIVEKESICLTEDLRSKFRYMGHLPVACNAEFIELEPDFFPFDDAVMDEFGSQLDERKRKRNKRAKIEKKRERKILLEENKMMGKFPDAKYRIESDFHFPSIGIEEGPQSARSTESLNRSYDEVEDSGAIPTFAKIIRNGSSGAPALTRSETFPTPSRAVEDVDGETRYVPERPSINFDFSSGVVVKKSSKKGKKSKNVILLSSAPRPKM